MLDDILKCQNLFFIYFNSSRLKFLTGWQQDDTLRLVVHEGMD